MLNKIFDIFDSINLTYDKDLCKYGFSVLKDYLHYLAVLFIPLFILEMFPEFFLFLILYLPLRGTIGGLHFKKKSNCFIFSIIITIIICGLIKYEVMIESVFIISIITICLLLFLKKYGCMDCVNKVISKTEKKFYKNKSYIIVILYFLLSVISLYFKVDLFYQTIFLLFLFFLFSFFIFHINSTLRPSNNSRV